MTRPFVRTNAHTYADGGDKRFFDETLCENKCSHTYADGGDTRFLTDLNPKP